MASTMISYKDIIATSSAAVAAAFALAGSIYLSVFMVAAAVAFYLSARKKVKASSDMQLYSFLRSLSRCYKRKRSMLASLEDSLTGMSDFENKMSVALQKYKNGDAAAFHHVGASSAHSSELVDLIWRALHFGDDVYVELCSLKYTISSETDRHLKRIGQVNNARFVSLVGLVFFFPLFAGIGIAILASAPQLGSPGAVSITSITFVFAAYLAIQAFVHFKDDSSMNAMRKASSTALCSSFGLLLLKAGSLFAISAI